MTRFLNNMTTNPAATPTIIETAENELRHALPADYIEFLKNANGAEGFVGKNSYIMLWKVDELAHLNRKYEVEEYAPGLLIFGSDGGGEAYGFDTRKAGWPIVRLPFIGMDWSLAIPMADSFWAFMQALYEAVP